MAQVSSTQFKTLTTTLYSDNIVGNIGAGDVRTQMDNIADSVIFKRTGQVVDPNTGDDAAGTSGRGVYRIGDIWVNETANRAFICLDNTITNAIWTNITLGSSGTLIGTGGPAVNEIPFWTNATTLSSSNGLLMWNGTVLTVTGNIAVSGTVDGRDVAADGTKLDGIPANAISNIPFTSLRVDGVSTGGGINTLSIETGDGISAAIDGQNLNIRFSNNRLVKDAVDRTLTPLDNFSFICNEGAVAPVVWTLPPTASLAATGGKMVVTFFKVTGHPMRLKGAIGVTLNGVTENGGNESLITISGADRSFTTVVYDSTLSNTYYTILPSAFEVQPHADSVIFWAGDENRLKGVSGFQWNGQEAIINGNVVSNRQFNSQIGVSYTLAAADKSVIVLMNNGAGNVVTIPENTAVPLSIGTEISIIQTGVGVTSITADTGVTLNTVLAGTGAITNPLKEIKLYKVDTNEWYAIGDIGAVA